MEEFDEFLVGVRFFASGFVGCLGIFFVKVGFNFGNEFRFGNVWFNGDGWDGFRSTIEMCGLGGCELVTGTRTIQKGVCPPGNV